MMEFIHKIYCNFVTVITELITGLDHSNLKLWNIREYLTVQNNVETIIRYIGFTLIILLVISLLIDGITAIGKLFSRRANEWVFRNRVQAFSKNSFRFRDINTLIYEIKIIFNGGLNYVERN